MTKAAIDAFWAWWPSVKEELNRRLASRLKPGPTLAQSIREHVEAISPDLVWELGTGTKSAYQFCLSAQGDRLGRLTTQRWLERAPERDATWEFHAARQPVPPGASLRFADKTFPLEDFVFTFEEEVSREMLRLVAHHPSFPEIEDESLRAQITCLALDQTFGEDGVDRWISVTDVSGDALDGGVSLQGLRDAVTSLAERATRDRWEVMRCGSYYCPVFVSVNRAAKRIDNLERDVHLVVGLRLANPTDFGLYHDEDADAVFAVEEALNEHLGEHALFLGRITGEGRRELHYRVQEGGPAATIVEAWTRTQPNYSFAIDMELDPTWELCEQLSADVEMVN